MARQLRLPQVLLLIETSRAYGRGLVEGIARYAEERGPWSIHFEERGLGDPLPRWLKDWRGDGIISRTTRRRDMEKLQGLRLPIVELFGQPGLTMPVVRPREETIARLAAEHFLDRGLGHFAFFSSSRAAWVCWRQKAFESFLQDRGHECRSFCTAPERLRGDKESSPGDDRAVVRWLKELPQPCGVFCATDQHAMRLLRVCRNCGIAVPEQIAVLGVDNDPVICGVCHPPLSSIELGSDRIGYEAASLLDRMMARRRPSTGDVLIEPVEIVTRQSTDTLAIDDPEVAQAVRMIREQACRRARVSDVADVLGLSRRALEQRFQAALQRNPQEELIRVRMERAKSLLSRGETRMASIAKASGFSSLAYFSRAFRRHTGMTPRQYRTKYRQSASDS